MPNIGLLQRTCVSFKSVSLEGDLKASRFISSSDPVEEIVLSFGLACVVFATALLRSKGRIRAVAMVMKEKESAYNEEARNILPLDQETTFFGTKNQAWEKGRQRTRIRNLIEFESACTSVGRGGCLTQEQLWRSLPWECASTEWIRLLSVRQPASEKS